MGGGGGGGQYSPVNNVRGDILWGGGGGGGGTAYTMTMVPIILPDISIRRKQPDERCTS